MAIVTGQLLYTVIQVNIQLQFHAFLCVQFSYSSYDRYFFYILIL